MTGNITKQPSLPETPGELKHILGSARRADLYNSVLYNQRKQDISI